MKPTVEQNKMSRRVDLAQNHSATFPIVDSNYHTVALPSYRGGCLRPKFSSFRNISSEYFRSEARHEFCAEALAFLAIVITAAIPVLNNMQALADFLRVIGRF